jgi:hypothetical protein
MHLPTLLTVLPYLAALTTLSGVGVGAVPVHDSPRQRLLDGKPLPANLKPKFKTNPYGGTYKSTSSGARIASASKKEDPYGPKYRDPLDRFVDSEGEDLDPLPYRNGLGTSVLGPWNSARSRQNPDMVRPPSTDRGNLPNMRWSFADSHMRIEEGGWTRQTTVRELGTSVELASVNMRLDKGVIRELHWHKEAEWAFVLDGEVRVTAVDYEGGMFVDDLKVR